jgi:hypothetical protein
MRSSLLGRMMMSPTYREVVPHMASYAASLSTSTSADGAFAYLADFSNATEWDETVREATRGEDGPIAVGSTFDLLVEFGTRTLPLRYTVTEIDPPRRVVFEARSKQFSSRDVIVVTPDGAGSTVAYDATITMSGVWKLADPIVARRFRAVAVQAIAGIGRVLR